MTNLYSAHGEDWFVSVDTHLARMARTARPGVREPIKVVELSVACDDGCDGAAKLTLDDGERFADALTSALEVLRHAETPLLDSARNPCNASPGPVRH